MRRPEPKKRAPLTAKIGNQRVFISAPLSK
jgi:hypothetical protein